MHMNDNIVRESERCPWVVGDSQSYVHGLRGERLFAVGEGLRRVKGCWRDGRGLRGEGLLETCPWA